MGQPRPAGEERTGGPAHRRRDREQQPGDRHVGEACVVHEERGAQESEQDADRDAARESARCPANQTQQRDPQRHEREDQATVPEGTFRSASTTEPLPNAISPVPDQGAPPATVADRSGRPRRRAAWRRRRRGRRPRSRSASPARIKGGRVSLVIADPEVRRAPDHVDDPSATQINQTGGRWDAPRRPGWSGPRDRGQTSAQDTDGPTGPSEGFDRLARAMADWETVIGLECHVELSTRDEDVLRVPQRVRRRAQHAHVPGLPRTSGIAAGPEPRGDRADREDRPRARERDRAALAVPPEELLLSGHAEELPDQPVRPARRASAGISTSSCPTGPRKRVGITRVHMEEDTGKTAHGSASGRIHEAESRARSTTTAPACRSSSACREPDMRSPEEAAAYLRELRATLESLDVSDVRMEEGSLRCDANVSVRPPGTDAFGTKVEIKNMNSVRSLERALAFEIDASDRRRSRPASRSCRRRGTGTRTRAPRRRCARRRRRSTTATSPSPTSRRSSRTRPGSRRSAPRCRSSRARAGRGTRRSSG